jgi:hypothetical protein
VVDNKVIKKGFVKVFNTKQNFIKFRLENDGIIKEWELLYPYKVHQGDDLVFDYSLSAFCPRTEDSYWRMFMMNKSDASKLHNNYLYVKEISPLD